MSDPVKSSEIEDVLSSIRRLVSEESRVAAEPVLSAGAETSEDVAEAPEADALVLTPALRVHDGGLGQTPELDAVETANTNTDAGEPAEVVSPDTTGKVDAPVNFREGLRDVVMEAMADMAVQEASEATKPSEDGDMSLAASGSELNDAAGDFSWAEEAELADEPPIIATVTHTEDPIVLSEPEVSSQEAAPSVEDVQDQEDHDAVEDGATVTDAVEWEDHASDVLEEAEAAPNEVEEAPVDLEAVVASVEEGQPFETSDDGDGLGLTLNDADMATIDEATLREMVVDIVREELQGALGERITRNVRRLVRREIHRALASHELD